MRLLGLGKVQESVPIFKVFQFETQIESRTWLILCSFRPHTCAYLDTLHWQCVLPRVGWCGVGPWVSRVESKPSLFGAAAKKVAKRFSLCKLHGRNTSQLGAVDPLSYFTMINTYHSDHERKLHYESGIFIQKLCFVLKIFTSEGSHSKSWFKSGGPESRGGMVSITRSIQWWYYGPESRNRDRKGSGVVEKTEKYCAHVPNEERRAATEIAVSDSRGGMFLAFASVYGSWIAPENRNGTRKGSGVVEKTEKYCADARFLSCCRTNTVFLSFLSNRWPHSSSVSWFRADSTPLITCKGRKHSAARIWDGDFRGSSHVAVHLDFLGNFDYLSNSKSFSSPVSWFWTDSTLENTR